MKGVFMDKFLYLKKTLYAWPILQLSADGLLSPSILK